MKLRRLVVSISSTFPFLRNHLFQKENPQLVLFSAMVFRAVFRSSTVLKTSAIFFYSPLKLRAIQIAYVEAFDRLSVGAFVYQPIRMFCFVTSFCTELPYICTELPHFCIEFTKNCISISQSNSRNFFMYIIMLVMHCFDEHLTENN